MIKESLIETISQVKPWSWKVRVSLFVSVLGVLWLFTDPLLSFVNVAPILLSIGIWGYIGLIAITAAIVILSEAINHLQTLGKINFIKITLIVTQNGTRHLVKVPVDMQIDIFVRLFLEKIASRTDQKSVLSALHMYELFLLVQRGEGYEQLAGDKTLGEAGFKGGEICKIQGKILDKYVALPLAA